MNHTTDRFQAHAAEVRPRRPVAAGERSKGGRLWALYGPSRKRVEFFQGKRLHENSVIKGDVAKLTSLIQVWSRKMTLVDL